jgi:nucleotide-binding universal stress UspA family protein
MAENDEETVHLRKILVAVDTSAHSRAALEAAAILAKITEANISGIFVQEEHWNHIGKLSSVSAVNELTGQSQLLKEEDLQQQIELLAKRLQRDLQQISRRHQIEHSWNTKRGEVAEEILKAARDADLITIGRRGRSFIQKNKLGSTARKIIQKADKPVLILKKGLRLGNTLTVLYNATPQSRKGLWMALDIAEENSSELSVMVTAGNQSEGSERDKEVEKLVEDAPIRVNVTMFQQLNVGQFLNIVNYQHSGLLIIPKNQSFLQGEALEITIEHIQCPVLLVN